MQQIEALLQMYFAQARRFLTVNGIWGCLQPLLQDFSNIGKYSAYDFLAMILRFHWIILKKN